MRILSAFPGVAFAPRCEGSRLATIRREAALVPTVGSGRPIGAQHVDENSSFPG